jgi:hypothetical protein
VDLLIVIIEGLPGVTHSPKRDVTSFGTVKMVLTREAVADVLMICLCAEQVCLALVKPKNVTELWIVSILLMNLTVAFVVIIRLYADQ